MRSFRAVGPVVLPASPLSCGLLLAPEHEASKNAGSPPGLAAPRSLRSDAATPLADGLDFVFRDVQELQELLMILGRRALEFNVPAMHGGFRKAGCAHDRYPLFLRHHFDSPQRVS